MKELKPGMSPFPSIKQRVVGPRGRWGEVVHGSKSNELPSEHWVEFHLTSHHGSIIYQCPMN